MIKKLGQLWTDAVAYVMLLAGAGLSILFNVVNTLAVRGALVDWVDWVIAIGAPALVVGMVEMFVNARWQGQPWYMQLLRWLGTVGIGAVAMRASWTHGHALLLSRGQTGDVAVLFPLAIDFLAIMATALILSGRGHVLASTSVLEDSEDIWTDVDGTPEDSMVVPDEDNEDTLPEDIQAPDVLPSWMDGLADRTGPVSNVQAYALQDIPRLSTKVSTPPATGGGRLTSAQQDEVRMLMEAGRKAGEYRVGELRQLVAAWFGVNPKTIQRVEG